MKIFKLGCIHRYWMQCSSSITIIIIIVITIVVTVIGCSVRILCDGWVQVIASNYPHSDGKTNDGDEEEHGGDDDGKDGNGDDDNEDGDIDDEIISQQIFRMGFFKA